jgi:hypothetical protein
LRRLSEYATGKQEYSCHRSFSRAAFSLPFLCVQGVSTRMAFPDSPGHSTPGRMIPPPPRFCETEPSSMLARLPKRQHAKKRAWFWAVLLPLIVVSGVLVNWIFLAGQLFAAPLASSSQPGHNTFQQFQQAGKGKGQGQFQRPVHDPARKSRIPAARPTSRCPAPSRPQ